MLYGEFFVLLQGYRKGKPEAATSGFNQSNRKHPEAQQHFLPTAPSGCLQGRRYVFRCCYFPFSADGVRFIFVFAAAAIEATLIAAMNVVFPENASGKAYPRKNIARPKREKRTTVKQKTGVGKG